MGLFTSPEDEQMFRQQMQALITKRDSLSVLHQVVSGWVDVVTDETYAEVWPAATPEERRSLLIKANYRLTVGPTNLHTYEDLTRVLGEGPTRARAVRRSDTPEGRL